MRAESRRGRRFFSSNPVLPPIRLGNPNFSRTDVDTHSHTCQRAGSPPSWSAPGTSRTPHSTPRTCGSTSSSHSRQRSSSSPTHLALERTPPRRWPLRCRRCSARASRELRPTTRGRRARQRFCKTSPASSLALWRGLLGQLGGCSRTLQCSGTGCRLRGRSWRSASDGHDVSSSWWSSYGPIQSRFPDGDPPACAVSPEATQATRGYR